ncbi:neuroguidin-like protein [Naegleria gruberi]|uniref:Neuroguidin-like protein n=1 Tax=Naegleria gruberi TaxID=5762 RepID=D2VT76_NAEGR|nr:neuroguidin-like protein [Naegleria gruberi]EFC40036.1 neuroguidin-like protein [Naegleria gruberi]|eukprot:XP_002672780.1 neuroguidin-like protein [Naegleria gruberi strain NEG-M]
MPNTKRAASKNKAFAQQRKDIKKHQSEKPVLEDAIIDAESFQSETDKFQSKKLAQIRQKTGLLEKDKDRDIIQPLIQTNDQDDDDDNDGYADETSIDRKLVKQTVAKVTKKQKDESDDESEDDETQLTTTVSSDEDDEEEYKGAYSDEDESDEDISKLRKKALAGSSQTTRWKRNEFYEGQTNISQKTHTNRERKQFDEEEEEVKRMQEERAKRLSTSDYLDDFMLDSKTTTKKKIQESSKKEQVSIEEKLAIIQKDAPEFMNLLVDLKNKLVTVKEQLHPILSKVEMGNLATSEGLSYLETKYHLMLTYCTNILFYVLLKSSGKSVKDHPVLENLVELRLLLEKIKPIDERMKYQVDKLVKLANNIQDSTMTFDFKPNPDRLLKNDEEGASFNSDEDGSDMGESDEDLMEMKTGSRKLKTSFDSDSDDNVDEDDEQDTYVAPKMMAVSYDDSALKKSEKTRKKAMERIEKGGLLKELKNEFGDAPEESYSIGTEGRSKHLEAIEKAELESRQRLMLTKKDKKKIAEELKIKDPLTEMDSFHEFTALQRYAKSKNATNSKLALAQYLGDADEAMKEITKGPKRDAMDDEEKAMLESGALTYDSNSDFDEDEDDYYEEEDDSKKRKRGGSDFSSKKQKRDFEDENLEYEGRDESGKRRADHTIIKNRGLAAHKKEDQRNPRLRLKNKYKAKTGGYRFGKVKSQAGYSGESKISTGVVKSRKIKS